MGDEVGEESVGEVRQFLASKHEMCCIHQARPNPPCFMKAWGVVLCGSCRNVMDNNKYDSCLVPLLASLGNLGCKYSLQAASGL